MTILSSLLETMDYNAAGWNHIYNRNMDLLNGELLKLKGLLDTDLDTIADGQAFVWNTSTSKWEPYTG
jgi:hypothetical protein